MEQVLSSPRGHSDWESDQNSLGFLLLDMNNDVVTGSSENTERHQRGEPDIVALSFDEIFQENAFSLDDLFRASRYSGLEQTYPWERSSPQWDKRAPHTQELAEEPCCNAPSDVDTRDLINFSSASPTHTSTSMQATRQGSPLQMMDLLQPIAVADTGCHLDGSVGLAPLDHLLDPPLSDSYPLQRTTVVEKHLESQVTNENKHPSHSTPDQVRDVTSVNSAEVLDLTGADSERTASCKPELAPVCLTPLPVIHPSSYLPPCFHLEPPGGITSSELGLGSHIQSCEESDGLPLIPDSEVVGIASEQETEALSASNISSDSVFKLQARTYSPVDAPESDTLSVLGRTGSDPLTVSGASLESILPVLPGSITDGPIEGSPSDVGTENHFQKDESMVGELEKEALPDGVPKNSQVPDLESVLTLSVLLASPDSVPEQMTPVDLESTSSLSLQTVLISESSRENAELCENESTPETSCHLYGDYDLSILFDPLPSISPADDILNPETFTSQKETFADSTDASECQSPSDTFFASETELPSLPVVQTALDISPEPTIEPETETVLLDSQTHSDINNSPEEAGNEKTINTCSEGILDKVPHLLSPSLHTQEVAALLCRSDDISVNDVTQLYYNDPNGTINLQVPKQKTTEDLSIGERNCECAQTQDSTPNECVTPREPNKNGLIQNITAEDHVISDHDNQDMRTPTDSSGESSVDAYMMELTAVLMENLPSNSTLPAPDSLRDEVVCCVLEEDRDYDQNQVTNPCESVPSPPDSTPLSSVDCQLTQVSVAVEQRMGGASIDLADVKVEEETDPPVQCAQVDLPQVTNTLPNSSQIAELQGNSSPLYGDECSSGVCPPEETCTPLMEDNIDVPDVPSHEEMALDLCVSSDVSQDRSVAAIVVPVPTAPAETSQEEDHSALRAVFQALDQDGDGFVRIEEFMEFATAYGAEQVRNVCVGVCFHSLSLVLSIAEGLCSLVCCLCTCGHVLFNQCVCVCLGIKQYCVSSLERLVAVQE